MKWRSKTSLSSGVLFSSVAADEDGLKPEKSEDTTTKRPPPSTELHSKPLPVLLTHLLLHLYTEFNPQKVHVMFSNDGEFWYNGDKLRTKQEHLAYIMRIKSVKMIHSLARSEWKYGKSRISVISFYY